MGGQWSKAMGMFIPFHSCRSTIHPVISSNIRTYPF